MRVQAENLVLTSEQGKAGETVREFLQLLLRGFFGACLRRGREKQESGVHQSKRGRKHVR